MAKSHILKILFLVFIINLTTANPRLVDNAKINNIAKFVELPAEYDLENVKGIYGRLCLVDNSVYDALLKQGFTLHLFNGRITDQPGMEYLSGQQPYGEGPKWDYVRGACDIQNRRIYVLIDTAEYEVWKGTELHEIGHAVFWLMGDSKKFNEIHQKESESFLEVSFFQERATEYFAESFAYLMLKPDALKEKAPLTYEYMVSLGLRG